MASFQLIKGFDKTSRILCSNMNNASVRVFSSKNSSEQDSSSKEEKLSDNAKKPKTGSETVNRLNLLLEEMLKDGVSGKDKLILARPKDKRGNKQVETETVKTETEDQQIVTAVKNVAESIGGDKKVNELELLSKLLNSKTAESENLSANITDIIKGMKIDRESKAVEGMSRAYQVRQILQKSENNQEKSAQPRTFMKKRQRVQDTREPSEYEPIDLFGTKPLGIFTSKFENETPQINKTWQKLKERELRLAIIHPPANYFQEQILWTEQGKLWKFPIDNEYGLEEEKKVYFADHVFLEQHLEPWCPHKGPIRHFMELVCVGLSKNPYMTVQDKREHIEWYKNYFEDKKKLLQEVGAIPVEEKETPLEISPK